MEKFMENWRGRAWESVSGSGSSSSSVSGRESSGMYGNDGSVRMVGLAGILRKEQEMWESTDKSLQDAFQDLNALMVIIFFLSQFFPRNRSCVCRSFGFSLSGSVLYLFVVVNNHLMIFFTDLLRMQRSNMTYLQLFFFNLFRHYIGYSLMLVYVFTSHFMFVVCY